MTQSFVIATTSAGTIVACVTRNLSTALSIAFMLNLSMITTVSDRTIAPVSAAAFALFLRRNSQFPDSSTAFIDSATGHRLSYGELLHRAKTLASNLATILKLTKGDTALVLSPNILQVPILCFALLSLGVVVSPANPLSTRSELTRFFNISNPSIVFTVTSVVEKTREFQVKTVLLDSPEFDTLTKSQIHTKYIQE